MSTHEHQPHGPVGDADHDKYPHCAGCGTLWSIIEDERHEAHGGDESPDREGCPVCIADLDYFLRYGATRPELDGFFATGQWPGTLR